MKAILTETTVPTKCVTRHHTSSKGNVVADTTTHHLHTQCFLVLYVATCAGHDRLVQPPSVHTSHCTDTPHTPPHDMHHRSHSFTLGSHERVSNSFSHRRNQSNWEDSAVSHERNTYQLLAHNPSRPHNYRGNVLRASPYLEVHPAPQHLPSPAIEDAARLL